MKHPIKDMSEELKIFILDDDANFKRILEIRLKAWNSKVQIVTAQTVEEAKAILLNQEDLYDLAICDHHLPDGVGEEIIEYPALRDAAILSVSSYDEADLPARAVKAGAQHFLGKRQVTEPLFIPLIEALLQRKTLETKLLEVKLQDSKMNSIKTLLATLRHEINNPLGAVLGGAYLVRRAGELDQEQEKALGLIEESGNRIKHVIEQLCQAADLEQVTKADEQVYQVPGDKKWE